MATPDPCSIDEAAELAASALRGKNGETQVEAFSLDTEGAGSPGTIETKAKLGFMFPYRTQLAAFGEDLAARAITPLIHIDIKANNFIAKFYNQYKKATGELRKYVLGMSEAKDLELSKAVRFVKDGVFTGDPGAFDPKIVNAAVKVRNIMDEAGRKYGVDPEMFFEHRDLLRQRPSGILREPNMDSPTEAAFHAKLKANPNQQAFYNEVERKYIMIDPEATMTADYTAFMRGIANAHIRTPAINQLERDVINPVMGARFIRSASGKVDVKADDAVGYNLWRELVTNIYGGVTPQEMNLARSIDTLGRMFGVEIDPRAGYKISRGLTSAIYAGAMGGPGGRPASIIRQLFQSVPTYANYGAKAMAQGTQDMFKPGVIADLIEHGLLSSHMANLAETVGVVKGVGKVVSNVAEASLKVFSVTDQALRAITALSAKNHFLNTQMRYGAEMGERFVYKLSGTREMKDELFRLVKQGPGGVKDAIEQYMLTGVNTLQYSYGKANQPAIFRGPIGNLMSTFMSYPMNSFEMARIFAKQAFVDPEHDFRPMVRMTLATLGLIYAGSEFLNADLRSAFLLGSIPHSLAFPKIGIDTFQSGLSTFEWGTGHLFGVGETDYRKHQRMQNYSNFARDARLFVPGGLFMFEDVPKWLDTGSLARMFALTPKADVINEQARAATQEKRATTRAESGHLGGLSGLKSLPRLGAATQ